MSACGTRLKPKRSERGPTTSLKKSVRDFKSLGGVGSVKLKIILRALGKKPIPKLFVFAHGWKRFYESRRTCPPICTPRVLKWAKVRACEAKKEKAFGPLFLAVLRTREHISKTETIISLYVPNEALHQAEPSAR